MRLPGLATWETAVMSDRMPLVPPVGSRRQVHDIDISHALPDIDSDLYGSAKTIFIHLKDRILPGTAVFEEYFDHNG